MTMMTPPPPLDEDEEMLVPNSDYTDGIDSMEQAQSEVVSTVENQPTEEPPLYKFTWAIDHVSRLNAKKCYSDVFIVGGYKWRVLIFPKGNNVDHLSMYLDVADSTTLPYGWSRYAFFSLAIVNQIHHKFTIKKETQHQFNTRESDWGFTSFMPLLDVYDPTKGYLVDDTLIVEAEVSARRIPDYWAYDSKKQTGFVGLKNQGATCYMNSLLQTLYHIPYFRKAVYHMPTTENDLPSKSIPLALQSLFYKVQYSDTSVSTKDLTKSFGWDTYDSFMQHDVQELNRVLCEKLEDKMKGTAVEDTIKHLFEGHHMNYIECINVDYKSTRKESFYDLQLDVKGCRDVYASFDKYVEVEQLDGDNKYHAEQYGLQDARKGVLFLDFPPVLQLQLKRFEYDFTRDTMVKINDRYEFPLQLDLDRDNGKYLSPDADRSVRNLYTLHSVLVHSGGVHGGHYYAFIRPTLSDQWYKFDDERVTKEEIKRALEEQYGGEEELPQPNPGLINSPGFINTPFKFTKYSNAYMLVYIRESDKDKIICNVDEKDIAEHLRVRLKKEQEEKEKKRKEKTEAHLYTVIKVARDEDLADQIGKDIYFDLVDHDKVRSFRVQKQEPFTRFKEEAAKEFGIPLQYLRFWLWAKRQNHTYRPNRPLTPLEESQSVGHLREVSSKVQSPELKLFMEVKRGPDLCFLPPPEKKKDDILLFFKLYDPEKGSLRYVGRSFEKAGGKPADILPKINEMAGFPPDTEIELYEEIKFEPCVMCERIDKRVPFRSSQIEDGDIICFQKALIIDEEERYRYPHVRLFLEYVRNRQDMHIMGCLTWRSLLLRILIVLLGFLQKIMGLVAKFLLQIHYQINSVVHARHRCHPLARLGVVIDIIKHRASVPNTCCYLFHLIILSLGFHELQDQCCHLMSSLLDIFKLPPSEETSHVVGSQLQSIISKLVACYFSSDHVKAGERTTEPSSQVLSLLHRLTVDVDHSLYNSVKELDHFPGLDCFERIRKFHQDLFLGQTPTYEFIKFVKRTSSLPQQLRLRSLQSLHKKMQSREILCLRGGMDMQSSECRGWPCNLGIVFSVWRLVELCRNDDASDIRDLVGDFIARVGVGDPYAVTFHLLDDCNNGFSWSEGKDGDVVVSINPEVGVCQELANLTLFVREMKL